jgi:hypothetical protein
MRMSRTFTTRLAAAVTVAALGGATPAIVSAASSHHPKVPRTFKSALTPAQIQALSQNANQRVIVLLRNQFTQAPLASRLRRSNLATTQSPITNELRLVHARRVHAYNFINAVSATMSAAEVARLKTDPAVQAVVPDTVVQASPSTPQVAVVPSSTQGGAQGSVGASSPTEGSGTAAQACPSNPSEPLLEPEALQSMNVDFGDGGPAAAHSLANGAGVKVAVFPDGLDPNIPDFRRDGGTGPSAIFDYQDFTGEGTTGVTGGEEAFGDASSIIAQGNQTYDLSGEVNPAHPLPPGCTIKIEGVAPGASLAVMKVFGDTNFAFNSEILQGLDWAVSQDHVNVLSESFGGNPVPNPGTDPIGVFDQDAVNAGITVVVSSGDAGITNTIGTPAVDPGVISAGATTDYRLYQQTTSYGIQFGGGGWLSDQISGLSSSGVTEANNTVSVVAPGEAGWADCSTDTTTFSECADTYNGSNPQPIVAFGGTSQSAPLTAGVAALVIQSYRDTHNGSTPSPALVKQIIMSTARDIDTRGADQGAGLVDAFRAVQAARSDGNSTKTGDGLLYSTNAINVVSNASHNSTTDETVTNDGASTQTLTPSVRALGTPTTIASGTLHLNQATDPTFIYQTGQTVGDVHTVNFTVPARTDRLHAAVAWQQSNAANPTLQTVRFDLFDPEGRLVSQSRPQGPAGIVAGGFSEVEIHDAQPGTWKMVTFDTAFAGPDSYTGPLAYQLTSQSFSTVQGSVRPASATLAAGQSTTFRVTTTTPSSPGDVSESLVFKASPGGSLPEGTVPITLRTLAQVGQTFTGTVTGGNSRMSFYGQELPYDFVVQGHHQDIDARITVANPGYQILAFLVDPSGTPVDVQSSEKWDGSGTNGQTISLFRENPQPGTWQLLVVQVNDVESVLTSSAFTARLDYDRAQAKAVDLPDSPKQRISPGSTIVAKIKVTNTGNQEEAYMVDARRNDQSVLPLASIGGNPASEPLPINDGSTIPQFLVPPFSTAATIGASSTVPITLDTSPDFETPDVEAQQFGNSAVANVTAPEVPASAWSCAPAEQGPFTGTAPSTTFSCGADAVTNRFAPDVSTSAGNIWADVDLGTNTYNPLVLDPGQTGTITVSISPTDANRTKVRGCLTLETFNFNTLSSDEVATFPYAYRVGF